MQNDTINAKEIRQDLIGFLKRVKSGKPITVIYRSKPLVTVTRQSETGSNPKSSNGSPAAVDRSLAYARQLRTGRKPVLDPNKSIKELYDEITDEKYGIVR